MAYAVNTLPPRASLKKRTWIMLIAPPGLFLLALIGASIYFGASAQGDAQVIANSVVGALPVILLAVQLALLGLSERVRRAENLSLRDLGWRLQPGQSLVREIALGAAVGTALVFAYIYALAPLLESAQRLIGDYVPPGAILPSVGALPLPFFLANVVLAPFVEENIYRGYALARLLPRFGAPLALAISCVFFGLLHWAGGFWYVLLTGVVAGGSFGALYLWRRNVIVCFAAHLALNLIEFGFSAL